MIIYICQGKVALDITNLSEFMNKQRILKRIGVIFLLITLMSANCLFASGQQKNDSTIENLKVDETFRVYARGTSYNREDSESASGKTAALVKIQDVKKLGLECIAVDPKIIPYGSVIIGYNKAGREIVGVAVDTGGDVKKRRASKILAYIKGFSKDSPEYNAIVLDFHAKSDITKYWDNFTIIPYVGPDFKNDLKQKDKIAHIKAVRDYYLKDKQELVSQ